MTKQQGLKTRLTGTGFALATLLPGAALAHGGEHLHIWGRHQDEMSAVLALLALIALGGMALRWWRGRS